MNLNESTVYNWFFAEKSKTYKVKKKKNVTDVTITY